MFLLGLEGAYGLPTVRYRLAPSKTGQRWRDIPANHLATPRMVCRQTEVIELIGSNLSVGELSPFHQQFSSGEIAWSRQLRHRFGRLHRAVTSPILFQSSKCTSSPTSRFFRIAAGISDCFADARNCPPGPLCSGQLQVAERCREIPPAPSPRRSCPARRGGR